MGEKILTQNKRAYHDYFIFDKFEAGIVLVGTEIKSLRNLGSSFNDAYIDIKGYDVFLSGFHIAKYDQGNIFNHDPDRKKKLLLHRKEILKLSNKVTKQGYTIIPLKVYLKDGLAKIEIALAKGKKLYDKRDDLKKEDQLRYIEKSRG